MKTVNEIIKNDRCYACGLCGSVCPKNAISVIPDDKSGFYKVRLNADACISCGLCYSSCPAADGAAVSDSTVGGHRDIVLCHSTDSEVRHNASSGGAVNSIIRYLIESETVDSVLTVRENPDAPFETEIISITNDNYALLSESPRSFASRYVGVPVLSEFKSTGKTAVIGTPCQIKALSKFDRNNEIIKIGIACSAAVSYNASRIIKKKLAGEGYRLYYRGNGWPGYNTLTDGNNIIETPHGKSYFEKMYTSRIFNRYACRFCPSHFAEESDLSFFDFWNSEEIKNEKAGNSACIIRSERGEAVFSDAKKNGYIETVKAISEAEAVKTQGVPLKYKSRRPYSGIYFKLADIIFKTRLYRLIPLKCYKYFCRMLARLG
ncbi:MAG: Coenzyme F420 hydrogenase/dehydrogenase, beta subunit C-terminal domain [Eubacterium sp.]|nr:Coenzyme F420 hydrogenase/dehydrogenase, beta subunit C-terminal domain [Eubacterium sp.]